ncbi:MAG TPA: hypothetical protein PLS38_06560 [Solirubrobacterales bacterium]|nr:hypothetical protein [Solirubrobacterales bacterium]HNC14802.1 hypothetical protein [Solirubrobacterales bacterium]HNC92551.1 hypothetical protein [Solirubrobacterales bacterium]
MLGRKIAVTICCLIAYAGALSVQGATADVAVPVNISPANNAVLIADDPSPWVTLPDVALITLKYSCDASKASSYFVEITGGDSTPGLLGTTLSSYNDGVCEATNSDGYEPGTYTWRPFLITGLGDAGQAYGSKWTFTVEERPSDPDPDPILDTHMNLSQAKFYARAQTKKRFYRAPFRVSCWRKSSSSFGCFSFYRQNWRKRFRAKWVFAHVVDDNQLWYTTSFKGKSRYSGW